MDKNIVKIITGDYYEKALMNRISEEYNVKSITWMIGTRNYRLELELKE